MTEKRQTLDPGTDVFQEGLRRVGAVAQLTGLSTHTLRAWERRHAAVEPRRTSSGLRLYSEDDVTRLRLLKALTDKGEPISVIAALDPESLRERLNAYQPSEQPSPGDSPKQPRRIGLVNPDLAQQIRSQSTELLPLEVVIEEESIDLLLERAPSLDVEILVVEIQALGSDPRANLTRCRDVLGPVPIWVSYTFAPRAQLGQAVDAGAHLIRLPLKLAALRDQLGDFGRSHRAEQIMIGEAELDSRGPHDLSASPPERHFSNDQLAKLRELPNAVGCECPNHLSALISGLVAFEEYARSCEDLNPADASLHQFLERGTGVARSVMEELLQRLCEQDKVAL